MLRADELKDTITLIDDKWVCAMPMKGFLLSRLKDAIQVIKGNAIAVNFYKQK